MTIRMFAFVWSLALCTRGLAGDDSASLVSGTSFERLPVGDFSVDFNDEGGKTGDNRYWLGDESSGVLGIVTNYDKKVKVYDYAAHGTVRSSFFDAEGSKNTNYLWLAGSTTNALRRLIMPRINEGLGLYGVSNVLVRTEEYDGICFDSLVKFTASGGAPAMDDDDRIAVWLEETNDVGNCRLVVTAGRYADDFNHMELASYAIESPVVAPGEWHRLTVRAISNVIGSGDAETVPGFAVYVDGIPAVASADGYSLGLDAVHSAWLGAYARLLVAERRLFPWCAGFAKNDARRLAGVNCIGKGGLDDMLFTSDAPEFVHDEVVFTLNWSQGVKSMTCVISNADGKVVKTIDEAEVALGAYRHDFSLGTNHVARIEVTAVYDETRGYKAGKWKAQGDCTVSEGVFEYAGDGMNPIGSVVATRDEITVGGDGFRTFSEALQAARDGEIGIISLSEDFVITNGAYSETSRDYGSVNVKSGDDITIDLCGHTLQGSGQSATISQTGGKLRITDSDAQGRGRVLPPVGNYNVQSVRSWGTAKARPELIIDSGWYDGIVTVSGIVQTVNGVTTNCVGKCIIEGGNFASGQTKEFYLDQYVTNSSMYFSYSVVTDGYWSVAATDAFIWSGKGYPANGWDNVENWRGKVVPTQAGDTAVFPYAGDDSEGWPVDFGNGVAVKSFVMDGDIVMSGTNEFSKASGFNVAWGDGRIVGDGVATFTGELPGALTAEGRSNGEVRLGDGWSGRVRISGITDHQRIREIAYWGNAASQVEFHGVDGYVSDRLSYDLPYELVLTDGDDGADAWKNTTGFTGSTISFAKLSGTGRFYSPKNSKDVLQVIQFRDASGFCGVFDIRGKRLLLGNGSIGEAAVGTVAFANEVRVRSGLGWSGVAVNFAEKITVVGELNEVLIAYTGSEVPAIEGVAVHLVNPVSGATGEYELALDGKNVIVSAGGEVNYNGIRFSAARLAKAARAGGSFDISGDKSVAVAGNSVLVNGVVVSSLADYYDVSEVSKGVFQIQFSEAVTPQLASFDLSSEDGRMSVSVANARAGLYYSLQTKGSLDVDGWSTVETVRAETDGESVEFEYAADGDAGFLRVAVSDEDPDGGEE